MRRLFSTVGGLTATYYDNADFTGAEVSRVDTTVNFNWGVGSPAPSIQPDTFSARWTGAVLAPATGEYTFSTIGDDGVRLWVDDQQVINGWVDQSATEHVGVVRLTAGQLYDIKLDYYENAGDASVQLAWITPGEAKQIIPASALFPSGTGVLAQYFGGQNFDQPLLDRVDSSIDFDWGNNPPAQGLPADNFSVRWTARIVAPETNTYTFYTTSDDGVRLRVNGQLLVDQWNVHVATDHAGSINLQAGQAYDVQVEYFEATGLATMRLDWSTPTRPRSVVPSKLLFRPHDAVNTVNPTPAQYVWTTGGLTATYFDNQDLTGLSIVRTDPTINFDWKKSTPDSRIGVETFSARWTGQIQSAVTGTHKLYVRGDDKCRLWVDNTLVIDNWSNKVGVESSASVNLVAGQARSIRIEYAEQTGYASMRLLWSGPGIAKAIVPAANLLHLTPAGTSYDNSTVISWLTIGGSGGPTADRTVAWNIKATGWKGFVETVVKPQIAYGVRRFVLHNPFGTLPGEDMQFDQFIHAKEAGLTWLYKDFVEAWKPITDSGIEVIAYLGSIPGDPDFEVPAKQDPVAGWQHRFFASIGPVLDARMNLAFDAVGGSSATSTAYRAVRLAQTLGPKVYIEARPAKDMAHWFDFPIIAMDSFWQRSDPAKYADAAGIYARNEQLTGEIIRIIHGAPEGQTFNSSGWINGWTRQILTEGDTAATSVVTLMREKLPLSSVLAK